jgi:predicted RNA-binding protein with PIN domain
MDNQVITTSISTGGAVIVGLGGMWIATNQIGKRIDDVVKRLERLEDSFTVFKDVVNSKLSAIDLEIARILDKIGGAK